LKKWPRSVTSLVMLMYHCYAENSFQAFNEICNFDNGQADNPDTPADGGIYTMGNVMKNPKLVRSPPFDLPLYG
jgi:hypothetical protein